MHNFEPVADIVDLTQYFSMLQLLDDNISFFALRDETGEFSSFAATEQTALSEREFEAVIALLDRDALINGEKLWYRRKDGVGRICSYARQLRGGNGEPYATVLLAQADTTVEDCSFNEPVTETFLSQLLREIQLNLELNAAAIELTDRYEELNLIYGTEDSSDQFDKGRAVLKSLVSQCAERMNVDHCVLYLPDQNFHRLESGGCDCNCPLDSEEYMANHLLPYADRTGQAMVVNDLTELQHELRSPSVNCKMISCPVLGYCDRICGFIAVFNKVDRPDFTNSDRNLLQIIARKASRIVRSHYDELTGLNSKASFETLLAETIEWHSKEEREPESSLLFVDLRGVHVFNDTAGHDAGDELIRSVAATLKDNLPDNAFLARYDGDVFSILFHELGLDAATAQASLMMQAVNNLEFQWGEHSFHTNVCMGLVPVLPQTSVQDLTGAANIAMRVACDKGNNLIEVQRADNDDISNRKKRNRMLHTINDALKNDRFELHCQGVYDIKNVNEPHHYEILLRMLGKNGEAISPFFFIPAAEYYKIMPDIDRWVVHNALSKLNSHWDVLKNTSQSWAINLSGQTFTKPGFIDFLSAELDAVDIPPERIAFEVTETVAVDNLLSARKVIEDVKALGCEFYLDDFGTGLSSFTYLQELPFDHVKIDGSFIKNVVQDPVAKAMVKAIADVAQVLGMKTVAEYVENHEIIRELQKLGVEYLQGYGLHKPTPMQTVLDCLSVQKRQSA
jgi:diguanylate cyclase (GGDEF)-like protein